MHLAGFFEWIEPERGRGWHLADSLSLRQFPGLLLTQRMPDNSTLSRTRQRLPMAVHHTVLALILHDLRTDSSMKAIVRRDTRERYTELVTRLVRPRLIGELFQSVIRSPSTIGPRKLGAGASSTSGRYRCGRGGDLAM
jgi:hypothetical protein